MWSSSLRCCLFVWQLCMTAHNMACLFVSSAEMHYAPPPCAHIHCCTSVNIQCESMNVSGCHFFHMVEFKFHTFASSALPYYTSFCQTAPLLTSVIQWQNVTEYWWERSTSTAIPPTSTSDVVGHHRKNRRHYFWSSPHISHCLVQILPNWLTWRALLQSQCSRCPCSITAAHPIEKYYHESYRSPELEGSHKDDQYQLLASQKTTQHSNRISESTAQMLLEFQQLGAMHTALGNLFQGITIL